MKFNRLLTYSFAVLLSPFNSVAHAAEWVKPVYGEVRGGVYELLRTIGRESRGHLTPPIVILTGGSACDELTQLLHDETSADADVFKHRFMNNDGVFNMQLNEFLKKNTSGILMLRGRPTGLKVGQLVADRWYKDDRYDLSKFAVVFQSELKEIFANTLTVEDMIRHGYGGVVKGCEYHVIPGMIARANIRFGKECDVRMQAKTGITPEADAATRP